jgi:hypothetical protein
MVRDDFIRDRTAYEAKRADDPAARKPDTENYWRDIPGELFLLNGSEIATINVRHVRPVGILKPAEDERLRIAFAALRDQITRNLEEQRLKVQEQNDEIAQRLRSHNKPD